MTLCENQILSLFNSTLFKQSAKEDTLRTQHGQGAWKLGRP